LICISFCFDVNENTRFSACLDSLWEGSSDSEHLKLILICLGFSIRIHFASRINWFVVFGYKIDFYTEIYCSIYFHLNVSKAFVCLVPYLEELKLILDV